MLRNRGLVYGIAINDADYNVAVRVNGKVKMCPFYERWKNMIARCYCKSFQSRRPTYIGCTVCKEWLTFSNFKAWMEQQDWKGKALDKDILKKDNKEYSPEKCAFIDFSLNSFLCDCSSIRGEYPIGVSWCKARYLFE